MGGVALISVMHDPRRGLFDAMADAFPPLLNMHDGAFVVLSHSTHPDVERELVRLGAQVERETRPAVGASRRQALAMALRAGCNHVHYCDLDRALHWARDYPGELGGTLAMMPTVDLLVIGRTPRAFLSHPRCMIETERLANHVFELVSGRRWDLCAAARGISAGAAEVIAARSKVVGVGTEGEWPTLVLKERRMAVGYVEVEGMEYETPDRHPDAVAAAGGVAAWTEDVSRSPGEWTMRLGYASAIGRACLYPSEADDPVHIA